MKQDYYRILGVEKNAPEEEIKKAYRIIAKRYHPDANPGDEAAARRFREAAEAYAVLGDMEKRQEFDKACLRKTRSAAARQYGKSDADPEGQNSKTPQPSGTGERQSTGFDFDNVTGNFQAFFGFHPKDGKVNQKKPDLNKKTKTNPIDMTDLFEQYMEMKNRECGRKRERI